MSEKKSRKLYRTNKRLLTGILVLVMAGSIGGCLHTVSMAHREAAEAKELQCFKEFSADAIGGGSMTQKDLETNKLTLVNVWATTCVACIGEMPDLEELNQEYKDQGVEIVGMCTDLRNTDGTVSEEKSREAEDILKEAGVQYKNLIPTERLQKEFVDEVITATPTTLVLDSKGNVVDMVVGARSKEGWTELIRQQLQGLDA